MQNRIIIPVAAAMLWMLTGCWFQDNRVAGGDATETGNAIAGRVVLENGNAAAGAEVDILPADYNPVASMRVPDSLRDTADGEGRFNFKTLPPGQYNVEAVDGSSHNGILVLGVNVTAEKQVLPNDTLRPPGTVSVPIPETQDSGVGYIYVPGTTFRSRIDSELRIVGSAVLEYIPQGILPSIVYTKGDSSAVPLLLAKDVPVTKAETSSVAPYAMWSHSAKILVRTGSAGVTITQGVKDFALLVRLASPAFDFSQALPGGRDLRFAKADGTPLPFQIDAWDSAAGHAEVWVRLDTIKANDDGQFFNLFWGNAKATSPAAKRIVFDTAAGFAGVWHLNEEAPDTTADHLYLDATQGGKDGNDRVTSKNRPGVIGYGHSIDSGDYIESPKASEELRLTNAFTLSTWYRTDPSRMNTASGTGEMISVGDNYGLRVYRDSILHLFYWPTVPPVGSKNAWYELNVSGPTFCDGNWHLVMGTFDGATLRLYVDGREVGNSAAPGVVAFNYPINVTLGKHGNGKPKYEYVGDLDEVQIHSRVRSVDWHKLNYENQKPGGNFPALIIQ